MTINRLGHHYLALPMARLLVLLMALTPFAAYSQDCHMASDQPPVAESSPCHAQQSADQIQACKHCGSGMAADCGCLDQGSPGALIGVSRLTPGLTWIHRDRCIWQQPALDAPPLAAPFRPPRTLSA